MTTGEKIRAMRKKKGMTLAEVAQILNVSTSAVSQYERGKLTPSAVTILALASAFRCAVEEIATSEDIETYKLDGLKTEGFTTLEKYVKDPYDIISESEERAQKLARNELSSFIMIKETIAKGGKNGFYEIVSESKNMYVVNISAIEAIGLCAYYERLTPDARQRVLEYMCDLLEAPIFNRWKNVNRNGKNVNPDEKT